MCDDISSEEEAPTLQVPIISNKLQASKFKPLEGRKQGVDFATQQSDRREGLGQPSQLANLGKAIFSSAAKTLNKHQYSVVGTMPTT